MWDNKRVTYSGYHELAYLHPENFNADLKIIEKYELKPKSYFIVRLVKLTASHDTGKEGLKKELLNRIISKLSTVGKVYITSEQELDESLQPYRLQVNPLDIHHILAFAKLYIGDSQTMAAEAGVLGTPFIRYNDFVGKIGYLNELERKYVLGYGFKTNESNEMIKELERMITNQDLEAEWLIKKNKMLNENINLAEFMNWLFEKYPESIKILKESPNYEERFK
jgi:predicted glycosyltransferase